MRQVARAGKSPLLFYRARRLWCVIFNIRVLPHNGDWREAGESERTRRRWGQINDAAANEWPTIVDANRDRASVARMCNGNARAERERAMGGRHRVWIGAFAASGFAAAVGVDRGYAALGVRWIGDGKAE